LTKTNWKILVFRNGSIGNTLIATPLFKALKISGQANVTVVVDKIGYQLLQNNPYIDRLMIYDKRGKDRGFVGWIRFIFELHKGKFDTTILLKRFFRNELIAFLAGIPQRIGYSSANRKPFKLTNTTPYIEGKNIIDLNLDLIKLIDLKTIDDKLEVYPTVLENEQALSFLQKSINEPFIICHFGGNTIDKHRWSAQKYANLCDALSENFGKKILLIAGPNEKAFNEEICKECNQNIPIMASDLPIKITYCLIKYADFFVSNDSGPSHLADAAKTPGVILYAHDIDVKTQISKWKPKGDNYLAVYAESGKMEDITIEQVISSAERLI